MRTIKVSIITPCYNAEFYISKTIESVLSQTYKHWEMLIVDDCSTDNSPSIIKDYCRRDARIEYFRTNESSGSPALPRNIAIKHSKGEFIALLDCDDIWLPTKLEEQINFAESNKYQFVYSNYEKMTWEGVRNNRILKMREFSTYSNTIQSCEIPCLTVLLHKDIINGIQFKTTKKEDYVFLLEILKRGHTAYNTNKVHAVYRESTSSRSGNKIQMFFAQWYVLRKIEKIHILKSIYCIAVYAIKGLTKYLK